MHTIVILQGPTWFDALKVFELKRAAIQLERNCYVFKSTNQYDIRPVDQSEFLKNFITDPFDSETVQAVLSSLSVNNYRIWSSNEELTLSASKLLNSPGPSQASANLGLDKMALIKWLQSKNLPTIPSIPLNQKGWEQKTDVLRDDIKIFIKPKLGRGTISRKPWHYAILDSVKDLEIKSFFSEALAADDSLAEIFIGTGPQARFYDVHVWFGENEDDFNIFLTASWESAVDGRICKSFGPVTPPLTIQKDINFAAKSLAQLGFRRHIANLQFAEFQNRACLFDFNTRCAGAWALLQPSMAPEFYTQILSKDSLRDPIFTNHFSCYEKNPLPLENDKKVSSIKWPKPLDHIKMAYTEKVVPGYQSLKILNSLSPNPQVISYGANSDECSVRFLEFKKSLQVQYEGKLEYDL